MSLVYNQQLIGRFNKSFKLRLELRRFPGAAGDASADEITIARG